MVSRQAIWDILCEVKDPEIPVLTIAEMGILENIVISDTEIEIQIIPTYMGCPAMDLIKTQIHQALFSAGIRNFTINIMNQPAWTTDRINAEARTKMLKYGIAPPVDGETIDSLLDGLATITCPHCGSNHTSVRSAFGSTPCKALMVCSDCQEPFEYFKCYKAMVHA